MRRALVVLGVSAVLAVAVLNAQSPAVSRMYQVGGGTRDGASLFPRVDYAQMKPLKEGELDFKHYHSYDEHTALLKKWAAQYPGLIDMYSVAKSLEGRDIWQITITNKKTGKDTDKPAFFIEGGRHAGEITGIEATLYFINHVLTNYGKDAAITKLVDTKAIYAKPSNDPDGNSLYQYTAQSLRSTVRPYDSDGDGLLDEDPAEDFNGDGYSTQLRKFVGEGKGNARKDPADPQGRLMLQVAAGQGDYLLQSEGIDNDGDGAINEDGVGGLDLHRNYPENWRPMTEATGRGYTQPGGGAYPLSEPETKAVFDFLMRHTNVGIVQSLDTSVPMILRGPSTSKSEESVFPEDFEILKRFDAKGKEITGYAWAGDTYFQYSNRQPNGAAPPATATGEPLFGHGPDFGYLYYGAVWYGDEIWNGGLLREADANKDGQSTNIEKLQWLDANRPGKNDFIPWTKGMHPTLGEVECGGWNPKFWSQNPPAEMLETWAKNEAMFNVFLAQQLAQVKVVSATSKAAADGVFDVTMTVTNEGLMPTALEIAKRVKIVRPDSASIQLSVGQTFVAGAAPAGRAGGGGRGGGFGGRGGAAAGPPRTATEIGWLKPGETKTVNWQVRGAGTVTLEIASTRGGVDRKTLELK